ncbi:hypothetical protein CTEN210_01492 [Chaetoceros tenuissimus]|uniref:Reverse transcriptase domain-containing protein n=1 Tax=Chaetoceros tenuissimus TaxID=426638 RepID=A0AAD3GZY0_9STRA|nr:hypothetical protein CTEN210_01492 [Chaetoceros tenuissimus]
MGLLDLFEDPPDVKAYSKSSIQEKLSLSKECLLSTSASIRNAARAKSDRKLPTLLKTLKKQLNRLISHIETAETTIAKNISDTEVMINISQLRDTPNQTQDEESADPKESAPPSTTIKEHPPLISMNPKEVKIDKALDLIKKHQKFLKAINLTKDITNDALDKLSIFVDATDTITSQITLPFITDLHQQYITKIKGKIKHITVNFTNINKDFHSQFGDPAKPAKLIKPKLHAPPAANTTIPVYTDATSAPIHVPAIGPQQQKEATIATQQQQADKPPGKQLHFVELTHDQVGPNGIIYDPTISFTAKDLTQYHPAANQFPPGVQEEIIQAHEIFPSITENLKQRYRDNQHKPEVEWPFRASITTCPDTQAPLLKFHNEQPSMKKKIPYVPSAARLNGFTLNVLARLHPCWMRALDKLTDLILITRILPRQIKTTGRVLIDKPNSTDKRPISILHAYDSYIDNIVAQHLAQAVEDLNIYDDTIAAYRPGHSCADCTLNHLLAIQDTRARPGYYMCQLDEDKEKYFDRITTELQLLPFHLMGFPNNGYMEWIAESLNNVTVLTATPFGTVQTAFHCGVRQGSTLSCVIANAVAWLSAAPWAMSLMNSPSPPGHQPAKLHPFDITHGHNAMLQKASYCDDSSAYITSTNPQTLFDYISRDIAYSNIISIVTKLSINAKKSRIRIYNLPSRYPIPSFHYVSWHHLTKTVQAERIPTDNMVDLSPTSTNRHFGTFSDKLGHTQSNQRQHFPKMHASRKSFKDLLLHPSTFSKEYPSLVTSTLNFNVLAMTYDLAAAIKDDHITLYSLAAPTYGLRPAADALSTIFLPPSALGHNFTGVLTLQLATATARELFVTLNAPHPQQTSLLQSRARATLHRLTTTAPVFDPLDTIPHALEQLALLGVYLLPTSYPIANQAMTHLIKHDESCTALGFPQFQEIANTSPLKHLLNYHNTKYILTDKVYRSLLLTLFSLHNTMDTPFHKSSTFQEIQYTSTMPTPVHNPYHTPQERASLLRSAASNLRPQYNHLSHILQLDFLRHRSLAQPQKCLNNKALSPALFEHHSLFPPNTYDPWPVSPIQSLRDFHNSHTLPPTADGSTFSHPAYIQQTHGSPLLYSSDSGFSNKTGFTVASSILLSFTTETINGAKEIQLDKPVLPVLLRNHILAETYGTKETDNNMGEAQGLILSLLMAPANIPSIFLIDSKIALLQIMAYFHPSDTTIRNKLRQQIHTTSMYHYSELQEALLTHWPDPSYRPSEIPMQHTTYEVRSNFLRLLAHLQETLDEQSIVHLTPTAKRHNFTTDTKGICIGHHLFLHINSHQLTNTGRLKIDKDTNETIPPSPNFALAHANTFADRFASRMTIALPRDIPQCILKHIPQPPITALQYVYFHNSRVVNSDSSTYFKEQFVQHNYTQVLRRPDHWYLHYAPHFTDPTGKFASDKILRTLAQERATSHQRLIRINKSYRQHFQNKRHPLRNDMPPTLITSKMLCCPFCTTSSNSATALHLHLQCTDPSIHKDRIKHIYKLNETLEELDLVTQYMIASIYPMTCNTTAPVWEFSTFLRTAIDRTSHERPTNGIHCYWRLSTI